MRRERDSRLVLGIDPGSHACGYGVIEAGGGEPRYVSSGTISLPSGRPLHHRLKELHEGLVSVIREFRPTEAAVEKVFFAKSARAALSLGQARGVALLAVSAEGLSVHEYTALEVKKALTGYGRAEKRQVQEMICAVLGIRGALSPDGADALALAFCHMNKAWLARAVDAADSI
ncbi:MAG: crossover junction endodeoxyribonuclease RuvC [Thermodesulfovibrionales bacterium]